MDRPDRENTARRAASEEVAFDSWMRTIRRKCSCLVVLLLSSSGAMAQARQPLLADTHFAEGFGAAFIYGTRFSGDQRPPTGQVLA